MHAHTKSFCSTSRILDILILQDKKLFCVFEAGDIGCWLVNPPIASWTCSSLPTVAEFVKLTQSTVIEIQPQFADLYKVQLCNRQLFVGVPAIYVVKVYECRLLVYIRYGGKKKVQEPDLTKLSVNWDLMICIVYSIRDASMPNQVQTLLIPG